MQVGDAGQEDADRDQGKANDVQLMWLKLEPRQPQGGARAQQGASSALRRRLLSLAGCHLQRDGFDERRPLPPYYLSGKWPNMIDPRACSSPRTTTRSPRYSSVRCASRATRSSSPPTASSRWMKPTRSSPTS